MNSILNNVSGVQNGGSAAAAYATNPTERGLVLVSHSTPVPQESVKPVMYDTTVASPFESFETDRLTDRFTDTGFTASLAVEDVSAAKALSDCAPSSPTMAISSTIVIDPERPVAHGISVKVESTKSIEDELGDYFNAVPETRPWLTPYLNERRTGVVEYFYDLCLALLMKDAKKAEACRNCLRIGLERVPTQIWTPQEWNRLMHMVNGNIHGEANSASNRALRRPARSKAAITDAEALKGKRSIGKLKLENKFSLLASSEADSVVDPALSDRDPVENAPDSSAQSIALDGAEEAFGRIVKAADKLWGSRESVKNTIVHEPFTARLALHRLTPLAYSPLPSFGMADKLFIAAEQTARNEAVRRCFGEKSVKRQRMDGEENASKKKTGEFKPDAAKASIAVMAKTLEVKLVTEPSALNRLCFIVDNRLYSAVKHIEDDLRDQLPFLAQSLFDTPFPTARAEACFVSLAPLLERFKDVWSTEATEKAFSSTPTGLLEALANGRNRAMHALNGNTTSSLSAAEGVEEVLHKMERAGVGSEGIQGSSLAAAQGQSASASHSANMIRELRALYMSALSRKFATPMRTGPDGQLAIMRDELRHINLKSTEAQNHESLAVTPTPTCWDDLYYHESTAGAVTEDVVNGNNINLNVWVRVREDFSFTPEMYQLEGAGSDYVDRLTKDNWDPLTSALRTNNNQLALSTLLSTISYLKESMSQNRTVPLSYARWFTAAYLYLATQHCNWFPTVLVDGVYLSPRHPGGATFAVAPAPGPGRFPVRNPGGALGDGLPFEVSFVSLSWYEAMLTGKVAGGNPNLSTTAPTSKNIDTLWRVVPVTDEILNDSGALFWYIACYLDYPIMHAHGKPSDVSGDARVMNMVETRSALSNAANKEIWSATVAMNGPTRALLVYVPGTGTATTTAVVCNNAVQLHSDLTVDTPAAINPTPAEIAAQYTATVNNGSLDLIAAITYMYRRVGHSAGSDAAQHIVANLIGRYRRTSAVSYDPNNTNAYTSRFGLVASSGATQNLRYDVWAGTTALRQAQVQAVLSDCSTPSLAFGITRDLASAGSGGDAHTVGGLNSILGVLVFCNFMRPVSMATLPPVVSGGESAYRWQTANKILAAMVDEIAGVLNLSDTAIYCQGTMGALVGGVGNTLKLRTSNLIRRPPLGVANQSSLFTLLNIMSPMFTTSTDCILNKPGSVLREAGDSCPLVRVALLELNLRNYCGARAEYIRGAEMAEVKGKFNNTRSIVRANAGGANYVELVTRSSAYPSKVKAGDKLGLFRDVYSSLVTHTMAQNTNNLVTWYNRFLSTHNGMASGFGMIMPHPVQYICGSEYVEMLCGHKAEPVIGTNTFYTFGGDLNAVVRAVPLTPLPVTYDHGVGSKRNLSVAQIPDFWLSDTVRRRLITVFESLSMPYTDGYDPEEEPDQADLTLF